MWLFRGVPENPSARLMASAWNKAIDGARARAHRADVRPALGRLVDSEWTLVPAVDEQFSADAMQDDLLRLMCLVLSSGLKQEAQVALVLHILCGFQHP